MVFETTGLGRQLKGDVGRLLLRVARCLPQLLERREPRNREIRVGSEQKPRALLVQAAHNRECEGALLLDRDLLCVNGGCWADRSRMARPRSPSTGPDSFLPLANRGFGASHSIIGPELADCFCVSGG